jgi:hypothetical protein
MAVAASVRLRWGTHTAHPALEHPLQTVTLGLWGTVLITFRLGMGAYHAMNLRFLPFEADLSYIQSATSPPLGSLVGILWPSLLLHMNLMHGLGIV